MPMLCRDMGSIDAFRLGDVRTIQNVRAPPADWETEERPNVPPPRRAGILALRNV